MIVKILASASNFAGIHYNERKNDSGKSALLAAKNFGSLLMNTKASKADYINYLSSWCNKNPRVKKVQFHAVISAKGKDISQDKLKDIGEQFLHGMGYGKNPYLIYHHGDTENRHIHLVSTRVDPFGKKVDDRFEKLRSQQVMHQLLSRDPQYEADNALNEAFQYQFSTVAQFKLLLELSGFKFVEKAGGLYLSKYCSLLSKIDQGAIDEKIAGFTLPQNRAAQLKAILNKYNSGKLDEAWKGFMKEKFGLDIVFHQRTVHDLPYGYTIVDHPSKVVFKGSQVMKLNELLHQVKEEKVRTVVSESLKERGLSLSDFDLALSKLGLKLGGSKVLWEHGSLDLSSEDLRRLHKYEKLHLASMIRVNDLSCKAFVGKLLGISPSAYQVHFLASNQLLGIKATAEYLDQSNRWRDGLEHFGFHLLRDNHHIYLFSPKAPALLALDKLLGKMPENLPQHIPHIHELSAPIQSMDMASMASDMLEAIILILADAQQGRNEEQKRKYSSIKL